MTTTRPLIPLDTPMTTPTTFCRRPDCQRQATRELEDSRRGLCARQECDGGESA